MHSIKWVDGGLLFIIHGDIQEMKVTKIIDSSLAEDVKEKTWRKERPRGLLLQNAMPACDVPSAPISTQGLWKEGTEPINEVQDGASIREVNIYDFANIIFCGSKNIKPSATFEFATFEVFSSEGASMSMCMPACIWGFSSKQA